MIPNCARFHIRFVLDDMIVRIANEMKGTKVLTLSVHYWLDECEHECLECKP